MANYGLPKGSKIVKVGKSIIIYIDKNGNKRWKHRTQKGAIWGK